MNRRRKLAFIPLIVVGIAFINIAMASGRRAFIGIGVIFIIVGIALFVRRNAGVKTPDSGPPAL